MTKRLIDAAEVVLTDHRLIHYQRNELQAAVDEARQPVTVTEEQAVGILLAMLSTFGEPATQAEVDALSAEDKQEIVTVVAAILQKARELGL